MRQRQGARERKHVGAQRDRARRSQRLEPVEQSKSGEDDKSRSPIRSRELRASRRAVASATSDDGETLPSTACCGPGEERIAPPGEPTWKPTWTYSGAGVEAIIEMPEPSEGGDAEYADEGDAGGRVIFGGRVLARAGPKYGAGGGCGGGCGCECCCRSCVS